MFIENTEYEILTPSGWQDFKGLTKTENKLTYRITLENNSTVDATADHYFFSNNAKVKLKDFNVGDSIDTINGPKQILSITSNKNTSVFDVIEVSDIQHQFIVNNCFITKNCDEMAHLQPNIATTFWSSISPTLSTGGRAIITSTPNSDEDMFATIWKESQDLTDEFGNIKTDGTGRNGFYGFRAYWWEHPDRDETWKQRELNKIGEELFRREFACCAHETKVTVKDQNNIFDIEIGQLFDTNLVNDQILYKDKMLSVNNKNYQVLTPNGFQPFEGVAYMGDEQILELRFDNGKSLRCTLNHKIYINLDQFLYAHQLELGDKILTLDGYSEITAIVDVNEIIPVYDLIEVANGHRYWTNSILSSNCEFLVYDETLVNSIKLAELSGREPMLKTGQVRWYKKPSPGHVYLVALDPSMGTGSNNAAIEIFELPNFVQVGEWYHNITPVQSQVKILRDILRYIQNEIGAYNSNNIYWSCENNTVGEAALIVINDLGEDTFPGYFLSEPIKKGHVKKFRKGFNTTFGNKISACSRLKFLVEQDKMTINSYSLISELKSYIAAGTSFRAKQGTMDDLVSATLLVVRMSVVLADWDPKIFEALSVGDSFDNDWDEPMPIFISTNYG